ncbi:MAG: RNA 2'-phosphotransferase [Gemmatales bacterium]
MNDAMKHHSKFLSLVLRHHPEVIGLQLDEQGWASVAELLSKTEDRGLTQELLQRVVAENDKKRFSFSADGLRIRANQGHSLEVDLQLEPVIPPEVLFHGTATRFLESIFAQGLLPGSRQHVHLSADEATAMKVGSRHGKPVVLRVNAMAMSTAGYQFYRSANGVWLVHIVPVVFLELL